MSPIKVEERRTPLVPMRRSTRVLVAEDDPEMRLLLEDALVRSGYDVVAVGNLGAARQEMLVAAQAGGVEVPAVLVTDRRMPDGDGLDLVAELRRRCWWLPAVVVTAFADAEVYRRARSLGSCQVLSKPVDLDLVRVAVREAMWA